MISMKDLKELVGYLDEIEQFVPLAQILKPKLTEIVNAGTDILSALEPLVVRFSNFNRERNVDTFNYYLNNGFTRNEALTLILANKESLQQQVNALKSIKDNVVKKEKQ